jgi:hypothetical protein
MHHEGLVPQPLFLMGAPDGCRAILETVLGRATPTSRAPSSTGPPSATSTSWIAGPHAAHGGRPETFEPFAGPAERLTGLDIDDLNRLYQLGFRAGFPASVIEDGSTTASGSAAAWSARPARTRSTRARGSPWSAT